MHGILDARNKKRTFCSFGRGKWTGNQKAVARSKKEGEIDEREVGEKKVGDLGVEDRCSLTTSAHWGGGGGGQQVNKRRGQEAEYDERETSSSPERGMVSQRPEIRRKTENWAGTSKRQSTRGKYCIRRALGNAEKGKGNLKEGAKKEREPLETSNRKNNVNHFALKGG